MFTFNSFLEKILFLKLKSANWFFYFLIVGFLIYLLSLGAIQAPDSEGYLQASISRSPGYPLFIKLMQFISKDHTETLLVMIQLLFGVWATLLTAKTFQKIFSLEKVFFILFVGILLIPYVGKTGNYILTEGLAYPLFLFSMCYLLKGLVDKNNQALSLYFIYVTTLVLVRGQFLFMYVVGLFGLIYSFQYNKRTLTRILLGILLVVSLTSCYVIEKIYHKLYHGVLALTPFTGVHFIIQPLYISNIEDANLFEDPNEKRLFLTVRQKMEERKMSHVFTVGHIDAPYHLYAHFDEILYGILHPTLSQHGFGDLVEVDGRLKKMAIKLVKKHPKTFVKLYIRNLVGHLGGYYNACIVLFIFILSFFYIIRYKNSFSLCAFLFGLVVLGNSLLVALVQSLHIRYTFYSDVMLCCLLMALLYKGFKLRRE